MEIILKANVPNLGKMLDVVNVKDGYARNFLFPRKLALRATAKAKKEIEQNGARPVPLHLMDGSRDAKGFGHGQGYQYPHLFTGHFTPQQYLPVELAGTQFYEPSDQGCEAQAAERVAKWRKAQAQALGLQEPPADSMGTKG